jgi:hypothetical protein
MADNPTANTDRFRNFLAFFLISAFVSVLPLLIFKDIPKENKEIIVYIIGQLSGMATTALGLYFVQKQGAEALDAKRAETTKSAFEAVTATAQASTAASGDATKAADAVADAAAKKADDIASRPAD